MEWNPLQHPYIVDGYEISPYGDIRYNKSNLTYKAAYHSSNGYDYAPFILRDSEDNPNNKIRLFPIDEIIAMVYIPVPHELCGKRLTIKHINGDNRDISLDNLEWIEDIEIWKTCTYPGVKPNTYEVSNHGNVRNIITDNIHKNIVDTRYGYHFTGLTTTNGLHKHFFIHRIVSWEFVINRDYGNDVNHIDGIKAHNFSKNLEWVDRKTNLMHAQQTDLNDIRGEKHPNSMFNEKCISLICEKLLEYNGDINKVVKYINTKTKYEVTRWNVERIKYKKNWVIVSDKYFTKDTFPYNINSRKNGSPILNESDVKIICETLLAHNMDVKKTYALLMQTIPYITHSQIYKIKKKYTWSNISDMYF